MALDDNLTPFTREEEYLAAMAGEDVEIPEPITRKEKFCRFGANRNCHRWR